MSRESEALLCGVLSADDDTRRDAARMLDRLTRLLHNPAVDDFYGVYLMRLELRLLAMRTERADRVLHGLEEYP